MELPVSRSLAAVPAAGVSPVGGSLRPGPRQAAPGHLRLLKSPARDELAGRLIEAQEDERRRIAAELHDDLNQKLAVLSIELTRLDDEVGESRPEVHEQVRSLEGLVTSLSEDVRRLSHRLHPASIQHVGLIAGLRSLCAAFGRDRDLVLRAELPDLSRTPSPTVTLSLYRIAQEALQNVRRHARAQTVEVVLVETPDGLRLSIRDDGRGIDAARAGREGGLGLLSLRERGRLLGANLTIASSPGGGTEVAVSVPHELAP